MVRQLAPSSAVANHCGTGKQFWALSLRICGLHGVMQRPRSRAGLRGIGVFGAELRPADRIGAEHFALPERRHIARQHGLPYPFGQS